MLRWPLTLDLESASVIDRRCVPRGAQHQLRTVQAEQPSTAATAASLSPAVRSRSRQDVEEVAPEIRSSRGEALALPTELAAEAHARCRKGMKSIWISRRHSIHPADQSCCRVLEVLSALLAALITILSLFPTAVRGAPERAAMHSPIHYWHTNGSRIVDANGHPVRIAAVNWFGMENLYFLPAGLDRQPLDAILSRVRTLGFNAIRLPFSNQVVEANPVVTAHLNANPSLRGLHALDILDRIVAAAGRHNLRIILDNGRSDAGTYPQENGLWYTKRYPERSWIRDWVRLAKRYQANPAVVGVDLRDEPHTAPPGPWSLKAYLHQGATWGPYRGMENEATDWRLAAERAGDAVLAVNPHLLIIVEGLQLYPDPTQPRGVDAYWWGGILKPAGLYPVRLSVPHQLVYSPHEYGPYKAAMPFFGRGMTYTKLASVWSSHWAYLMQSARSPAPIFIGEFGTCGQAKCVDSSAPGSAGLWFRFFVRYLKSHPQIGWAFWALNGTSRLGDPCPNYILKSDWRTVRLEPLVKALRSIERPPPS